MYICIFKLFIETVFSNTNNQVSLTVPEGFQLKDIWIKDWIKERKNRGWEEGGTEVMHHSTRITAHKQD